MQISGRFTLNDTYISPKSGDAYHTLSDMDSGGLLKLTVKGNIVPLKPGFLIYAKDVIVSPRVGDGNRMSLNYVSGEFKAQPLPAAPGA